MPRRVALIALCGCALAAIASLRYFSRAHMTTSASTPVSIQSAVDAQGLERPPIGRWRLARPESFDHVVVFFEHILVRHHDVPACEAPFAAAQWCVLPEPPARTREQALALARDIAASAHRAPENFPALVERYSEDLLSRAHGGALGALPASQLVNHEVVLDALAALKPGEVSDVVESEYGFHVLRRTAPPPQRQIAGKHLVLGNDTTPWLSYHHRADRPEIVRTRSEARAIAQRVKAELDALPEQERSAAFSAQIETLSEHRDVAQGGDLGVWSSQEPTPVPSEISALAGLAVGEISEPIETPLGTELVQRTPVTPRARVAMSAIKLRFDPQAAPDHRSSRESVLASAQAIVAHLRQEPERFAQWHKQYCCAEPEVWSEGRGDGELTALLEATPIGAIAERAIAVDQNIVIAKRIEPFDPPEVAFDPPSPGEPDLEYLVRNVPASNAKRYLLTLAGAVEQRVTLTDAQRGIVEDVHRQLADEIAAMNGDERTDALYAAQVKLHDKLGDTLFESYLAAVKAEVAKLLLRRG